MILFGSRSLNRRAGEGDFYCPRCAAPRRYVRYRVEQCLTLCSIPVFSQGASNEHVECIACGASYGAEILNYPAEVLRPDGLEVLRRIAALALGEAGKLEPPNLAALRQAFQTVGYACTDEQIQEDWQLATQARAQLESFARIKAGGFPEAGRQLALRLCICALRGNDSLEPCAQATVGRIAKGLNLPERRASELLNEEHRLSPPKGIAPGKADHCQPVGAQNADSSHPHVR